MINLFILYTLQQEYELYESVQTSPDGYVSALGNDTQTHFVGLIDKTKPRGNYEPKV